MANPKTTVNNLVSEVHDILKHDNIDTRILSWITSTYNDIITRGATHLFMKNVSLTLPLNTDKILITTLNDVGNPLFLVYQDNVTNTVYIPRYVPMTDFSRTAHTNDAALTTGSIPLLWSIGPGDASPQGKAYVYIYPVNSTNASTLTLFYTANRKTAPVVGTSYVDLPYHFEHVLIWGAIAKGFKALRPALYPIAQQEYEQAISSMYYILGYRPDSVPVFRSVSGPYAGTKMDTQMGRYPSAQP